jgi:hypothetical protein
MKIYRGYSDQGDAADPVSVLVYEEDHEPYRLRHLIVHSPTGISHGYNGSGPADLALAILADYLGEGTAIPAHIRYDHAIVSAIKQTSAWLLHQEFKRDVVAPLPQSRGFTINGTTVAAWLKPRRITLDREMRERRLLALLGQRVQLTDGSLVDVLDITDEARPEALLVYTAGDSALHRTVLLTEVVRALGSIPDDDDTATDDGCEEVRS